ncbi:MAG: hypothetical protein KF745_00115 [Phycisphaeraceae bacterium]|nr:hypothetical protein [Phycisphaeraceae bacterium]
MKRSARILVPMLLLLPACTVPQGQRGTLSAPTSPEFSDSAPAGRPASRSVSVENHSDQTVAMTPYLVPAVDPRTY